MTRSGRLRRVVLEAAGELGFELAGIARVDEFPQLRHFAAWIENGCAGEMRYLARAATGDEASESGKPRYLRADLRHAFPWARSVVCCGMLYNTAQPHSMDSQSSERGWISRYAWGDDYHEVLLGKMRQLGVRLTAAAQEGGASGEQRVYVDTGPIVERVHALHAGLGWLGKNTCLIHERYGSFFFLGTLVCSLEIDADSPLPDRCGSCTRCIEACPTEALQPYEMNASRCIAYLNIELRGAIPAELRAPMGQQVVGCDICQDVCPWNRRAPFTLAPEFQAREGLVHPELERLADLSEEEYQRWFRRSAVKRAKYAGMRRNVAIAMGNSGNPRFRDRLREWAESDDPHLREHAAWGLRRLETLDDGAKTD